MIRASFSWALAEHATISANSFLFGILIVRLGGIELLGQYGAALLLLQLILALQGASITSTLLVVAQEKPPLEKQSLFNQATTASVTVAISLLALICVAYLADVGGAQDHGIGVMVAGGIWVATSMLYDVLKKILYAAMNARRAFASSSVLAAVQNGGVFAVPFGLNVEIIFWISAIGNLAAAIVCVGIVSKVELPSKANVSRFWRSSKWLVGSAILHWLSGNSVMVAVGVLLGPAALGAMRAAQNILGASHVVFQAIENMLPQKLRRAQLAQGACRVRDEAFRLAAGMFAAGVLLAALLFLFGEFVLQIAYDTAQPEALTSLRWYALIYVIIATALPLRVALKVMEDTKPLFWGYCCTAALATGLASSVIERFGLFGAMALILASQLVPLVISSVAVVKKSPWSL